MPSIPDMVLFRTLVFFAVFAGTLPIARFLAIRKQSKTRADIVSAVLYSFASAFIVITASGFAHNAMENIRLTKSIKDPVELNAALLGPSIQRMFYIMGAHYVLALWTLKGAFLAFYWRLFSRASTRRVRALHVAIGFVACASVGNFLYFLGWCHPIENNWTPDIKVYEHCSVLPNLTHHTVTSVFNMVGDVIVLIVPMLILSSLQLPFYQKIGLVATFAFGAISIISSIVRYTRIFNYISNPPLTPDGFRVLELWSVLELVAASIAFSLPAFKVVVMRRTKHRSKTSGADPQGNSYGSKRSFREGFRVPRHPMDTTIISDEVVAIEIDPMPKTSSQERLVSRTTIEATPKNS